MNLNIFFDESGKLSSPPMLMGAISIPEKIYAADVIQQLNKSLEDNKDVYHFTKYNGDKGMRERIINLFKSISPFLYAFRGNILKYQRDSLPHAEFKDMVYSKFPERVFYGLLRGKGNLLNVNANIFMEDASEYKDFPELFERQLNIQAMYRGEHYRINNCCKVPKFTEIGVELTDIILGIIRVILRFEQSDKSKAYNAKVSLINELLAINNVYTFFSEIKYFEWDSIQSIKEINFKDYLDSYIFSNYVDQDIS